MKRILLLFVLTIIVINAKSQVYQNLSQTTNNTETLDINPYLYFYHNNYLYYSDGGGGSTFYKLNLDNFKTEIGGVIPSNIINTNPTMQGSIVIGNNAYLLSTGGTFNKYNINTNTFTNLQTCPSVYNYGAAAMTYDGNQFIYVWGGSQFTGASWPNQYTPSNQLWRYDIINNVWFQLTSTPIQSFGRNGHYIHPYIYFTSGGPAHDWNQIRVFNVISGAWSILGRPFPLNLMNGDYWNLSHGPIMFKNGNKNYMFGNWGLNQPFAYELHEFNPNAQTFSGGSVTQHTTNYSLKGIIQTSQRMNMYGAHTYRSVTYILYGGYDNRSYNQTVRSGEVGLIRVHPKRMVYVSVDSTSCYTTGNDSIDLNITCEIAGNFIGNNIKLVYSYGNDSTIIDNINNWSSNGTQYINRFKRVKFYANGFLKAIAYSPNDTVISVNQFPITTNLKNNFTVTNTLNRSPVFCQNELIGLYVNSNVNFTGPRTTIWQSKSNNIWNNILTNSNDITIINVGTYRSKVINNSTGCISYSDSIEVKTVLQPLVTISGSSTNSLCSGSTLLLTSSVVANSSGAVTYKWKKDGTIISGATSPTYSASSIGTYSLEVTNSNGCKNLSNEIIISVNPLPTVSISSNNVTSICSGSSLTITSTATSNATGSLTYQWYRGGNIINGATTSTYSVTLSGVYTLEVTNSNGCKATSSPINITVNTLPTVNISHTGSSVICDGSSLQLNSTVVANASGSVVYQWKKNGVSINGAISSTYAATSSGTYVLEVTNSNGCKATSTSITISTNPIPSVNITAGGATSLCIGNTVLLNSSVISNAVGAVTYQWKRNGVNISGATDSNYLAAIAGTYTLEVTNTNGCKSTSSSSINVIVNNLPTATISSNGINSFCQGSNITLSSAVVPNSTGSVLYQWKRNGINISGGVNTSLTTSDSGTYTLEVTNANGCKIISSPLTITMNQTPSVNITSLNATVFCSGDSAIINSTATANATGNLTYQWKRNGVIINGANAVNYIVKSSGNYTLEVTNSNGCKSVSNDITVIVNQNPIVNIMTMGSNAICFGSSVDLNSTVTPNSTGIVNYQWRKDGVDLIGETLSTYLAFEQGLYTLVVSNSNGCMSTSNPINITVNPLPTVSISHSGTNILCAGNSLQLNSTAVSNASGNLNYQWKKDGQEIIGAVSSSYNVTIAGFYVLEVTNSNGCVKNSNVVVVISDSIINSNIIGDTLNLIPNNTYKYSLVNQPAYNYLWSIKNGNIILGQGTNSIDVSWNNSANGSIKCIISNVNNCMDSSSIDVSILTTSVDNYNFEKIKIYPNPTNNFITIEGLINLPDAIVNLYDIQGKLLLSKEIIENGLIDLSEYSNSVYILKIGDKTFRVVKL